MDTETQETRQFQQRNPEEFFRRCHQLKFVNTCNITYSVMVVKLSALHPIDWTLRTIYEMPTVAVNNSNAARQRASVKWLLSKAFNNRVPDNLKEPFYRDHENQERLKPQIVVEMGNASLYCQTLSNLYSDPNYQSLNHWSILQTLARKGVPVVESPDMPLTETVLIQTNPLRINAHMSVIESLMILYAKEISSGDRIPHAVRRISGSNLPATPGQNYEQSILAWISHVCAALKKRITQEVESGATDEAGVRLQTPDIPPVRDFQDLCDGVCLALLISYYCPKVVPWTAVRINYLPAVEDSIHNVLLVSNFSQKHLPYSVFHMTPEDITYMRGSMKQNLIVLLADLFNLFEIHPAKCVCYPGMETQDVVKKQNAGANEHGICHRRGLTCQPVNPIPDLRSDLDQPQPSGSPSNRPPFQVTRSASANVITRRSTPPKEYQTVEHNNYSTNNDEGFVVHKTRGITTLSSMHNQEPLVPARLRQAKEKNNVETKADERGDYVPAGRPSNWEQNRRPSYAGRRSRRNSSSEDSQLTIENFGGSQDQLNTIGRGFDRDREREREKERKLSNTSVEPAVAVRSSVADARGTLQLGYDTDSGSEKQDRETEKNSMRRQGSVDNISLRNIKHSNEKDFTDADLSSQSNFNTSKQTACNTTISTEEETTPKRKTSFAALPTNTTTWQQQSALLSQCGDPNDPYLEEDSRPMVDATKLTTIRMKLEEKRRRIEQEKRKIEVALSKHQEKVGKAAFLQAINKGKTQHQSEGDSKEQPVDVDKNINTNNIDTDIGDKPSDRSSNINQDDIESSLDSMKWETLSNESKRTPDIDPIDLEKYQQSIAVMNSNLQDIQQDIHRLATQQSQIQAQHLQAQQLIQAQQIANMLHQQPYGSQQHIPGQYQRQSIQQGFGSTPHIPQVYNSPSAYNSRPPSRDPYQQQQQQPIQYINEHGQYVSQHPVSIASQNQSPYMQHPQNQPASLYSRGGGDLGAGVSQYENGGYNPYGTTQIHHPQYPLEQTQFQSHQQYISRPPEYEDYPAPHRVRDPNSPQSNQFYLHESSPQPTQRRTWAQSAAAHHEQQQYQPQPIQLVDVNAWQSQTTSPKVVDTRTWKSSTPSSNSQSSSGSVGGFMLHQNGGNDYGHQEKSYQNLFPVHSSPQHRQTPPRSMTGNHRESRQLKPSPAPLPDDMAPQSICFIGDEDDVVDQVEMHIEAMPNRKMSEVNHNIRPMHGDYENDISLSKLNITSGSLTYRIPSPSRPSLNANSFQDPQEDPTIEKGFYISFDDEQPKRPKPPLRAKRSPKKEKSLDSLDRGQLQNNYDRNALQRNNSFENNKATYNKYTDSPIHLRQLTENLALTPNDRRHLEDVTNQQQQPQNLSQHHQSPQLHNAISLSRLNEPKENKALVIGTELSNLDPESVDEMERRKEKIMLLSLQRRQQQEEAKARKEIESMQRREKEREKEEERAKKKEEQMARRAAILEQHRLKKAIEEAEREGKILDRSDLLLQKHLTSQQQQSPAAPRLRSQKLTRPRPKTIHVETGSVDISEASSLSSSRGKKGSSTNLTGYGQLSSNAMRRDFYRGSQDSLAVKESPDEYPSTSSTPIGRRGSYKNSREPTIERGRTMSRISVAKGSTLNFRGRKSNSLMNLCDTDSGLGRATPPRRAPSPGMGLSGRHLPSPSGPGSLPPGLVSKRRVFDDGSSDISSSNPNSMMEYSGPKLYKQPAAKSNRGIILNAVEYCVFPGAVNRDAKQKVLEKIARSEAKHFLILFRDAGCQFRALYSYVPENEQVFKLYGTGPSQVDEVMFDKFFKYNSGGKCFSQVHTKHLTVTIDAFTIHNSLWQGKKVQLPSKKDMALVI